MIPAALGVPTAFLYLTTQDYTLIVIGFALQGMFACGGMHVQYPAYLSERFPTEVRATAVAFCFHQGVTALRRYHAAVADLLETRRDRGFESPSSASDFVSRRVV
jgi:hypothetical protein